MKVKFRDNNRVGRKVVASWEMFLLVSFTIAIAFLMSKEVGLASAVPPTSYTDGNGKVHYLVNNIDVDKGTYDNAIMSASC